MFRLIEGGETIFRNPVKAGMVTGGEYSGSAVLVRASMADFALAVDTVGGARVINQQQGCILSEAV